MYDNEKQNGFPTGETSNNASQNQSEWNNQKQSAASSAQNTDRLNYESPRSSNQSAQNQTGQQNQTAQSQTTAGTNNTQYSGSYHYNQQQYRQQFGTSGTAQTAQTNWNYASQNSGYNQAYGQQQGTQGNPAGNYQPWGAVPPTKPPKQKKQKKTKNSKRKQRAQTPGVKNRCGIGGMRCNLRRVHWYICCAGQQRSDYFDCNKPANQQQR